MIRTQTEFVFDYLISQPRTKRRHLE